MRSQQVLHLTAGEQAAGARFPPGWLRRASATGLLLALLWLGACSGSDPPLTPLPERVSIQAPEQVEPDAVVAFAALLDRDAPGLGRRWSFGDGQTSTEATPRHRYAGPGRYEVVLDIVNEAGNTRSARAEVLVGRFSIVEGLSCSGAQGTGWCRQWPREAGYNELLVQKASIGWSVGADGQLHRTDESGDAWQKVDMGLPLRRLYGLRFANEHTGWALGVADDPPDHPGSRGVLLAKTTDGGRSWIRHRLPEGWTPTDVETATLQVLDPQRVLVVAGTSSPNLVSSDGGERWALAPYKNLLFAKSGTSAWVRTFNLALAPVLVRSVDLGVSLNATPPDLFLPHGLISNLQFVDDRHGWLTQETREADGWISDALWITTDGGASWSVRRAGIRRHPLGYSAPSLDMLDRQHGYRISRWSNLGRAGGAEFSSTADGGRTWMNGDFLPTNACGGGFFPMGGKEFIRDRGSCPDRTASEPFIELSDNLGQSWRRVPVPLDPSTVRVLRDDDRALRLRYPTVSFRSTDEGASWQTLKSWPVTAGLPDQNSLNAISFRSPTAGMAVVADGTTQVTEDGGKTWRRGQQPGDLFYSSSGSARADRRGRLQFVGEDLWLMGGNQLWNAAAPDAPWTSTRFRVPASLNVVDGWRDMQFIDARVGFALREGLGGSSVVLSTADGGQTEWRADTVAGVRGVALHFSDRERGLVVGKSGAILQTTDGGRSWTPRPSGTTEHLHAVQQVSASLAVAAGARGTVLVSRDGGTSWQRAALDAVFDWQRVHFADARHGWIVGDFGSVAHTRDGGQTWQMQRSATGEHLVDVFALDAGTAWAVSNRGMVYATASGGR